MNQKDLSKIELLVLDVDGVLTDGRITLADTGDETKTFNVRDGAGMKFWKRVGGKLAIISGRGSQAVIRRAKELDVDICRLNVKNKQPALEDVWQELGMTPEQTAVVGDDLMDVPMARAAAVSFAVADAVDELKNMTDYVTQTPGGQGAVREVVETILKSTGKWSEILKRYFPEEVGQMADKE